MEIYLLRHGIADDSYPDPARSLTEEGKDKLRRVLKHCGATPSLILSSPYKRALQTADIAVEVLGYTGEIERAQVLTPDGSAENVWDEIRLRKDERAVLLASHEPLMGMTVAFLLGAPGLLVDMKKAALVRIDVDRFGARPTGVLKWMLTPAVA